MERTEKLDQLVAVEELTSVLSLLCAGLTLLSNAGDGNSRRATLSLKSLIAINHERRMLESTSEEAFEIISYGRQLSGRTPPTMSQSCREFKEAVIRELSKEFPGTTTKDISEGARSIANRMSILLRDGRLVGDEVMVDICRHLASEVRILMEIGFTLKTALTYLSRLSAERVIVLLQDSQPMILNRAVHKDDPEQKLVEYTRDLKADTEFLGGELQGINPRIAKTLANQSYAKPRTIEDPHRPALVVLERYKRDIEFIRGILGDDDGDIAIVVAGMAACSKHSKDRPHGNCAELVQNYRDDIEYFRTNLTKDEHAHARSLAMLTFKSKRTVDKPNGIAPEILNRYRLVRKLVGERFDPEDAEAFAHRISLSYADSKLSDEYLRQKVEKLFERYKSLCTYYEENLPPELQKSVRSYVGSVLLAEKVDPSRSIGNYKKIAESLALDSTPDEKNLVRRIAMESSHIRHSRDAIERAETCLRNHRMIRSWVTTQLAKGEPDIAWSIANQSYHNSSSNPNGSLGSAPRLLRQYRVDRAWLLTQKLPVSMANKIALVSFYTTHSEDLPYGKAPEILKRYRTDRKYLTEEMLVDDESAHATASKTMLVGATDRKTMLKRFLDKLEDAEVKLKKLIPLHDHSVIRTLLAHSSPHTENSISVDKAMTLYRQYDSDRAVFKRLANERGVKVPIGLLSMASFHRPRSASEEELFLGQAFDRFLLASRLVGENLGIGQKLAADVMFQDDVQEAIKARLPSSYKMWLRSVLKKTIKYGIEKQVDENYFVIRDGNDPRYSLQDRDAFSLLYILYFTQKGKSPSSEDAFKLREHYRSLYNHAFGFLGGNFKSACRAIALRVIEDSTDVKKVDVYLENFKTVFNEYKDCPSAAGYVAARTFFLPDPLRGAESLLQELAKAAKAYSSEEITQEIELFDKIEVLRMLEQVINDKDLGPVRVGAPRTVGDIRVLRALAGTYDSDD